MRRPALALLLGCLLLVAGASALDGYDYYQTIEYAGCDQDIYQQDIVIHRSTGTAYNETAGGLETWHIYAGEHCQADYGDIRFTNSTGAELAYYLWPDFTSESARLTVRLEGADAAGAVTVHYGNPSATTTSDGGGTFERVITGLVFSMPLDEGAGNIVHDRSGKGNNGTLINGPSWVDGRANKKAISLDGINDYISAGSPTNLGLVGDHAYTLAIWVNPSACRKDGSYISYGLAAASKVISINALDASKIYSVHYANDHSFSTPYEMNVWQHVVITYDPATSTESLFVNGEYKENWGPANLNLVAGSKLEVGKSVWNAIVAGGSIISDAQIYDRPLSSDEIGDLYAHANVAHESSPGNTYIRIYSATPPATTTFSGEQETAAPPVTAFTATPSAGLAPLTVQFTDTSTGSPTSWSWSFGDGNTSTAQNPQHTYTVPGTYSVNLTATNEYGSDYELKTDYITVYSPITAQFTANVTGGTAPVTVQFTDRSTGGPTSWSWTFGDGNTSTAQNPAHTYTTAGTHTVTLTASHPYDSDTETKPASIIVAVLQPFPGLTNIPRDLTGNGLYTDINGNNRLDYNDLTVFFQNLAWAKTAQPIACFDFNGNGWLDYNDVITLFMTISGGV